MNIMLYGAAGPEDRHSETLCRAAAHLLRRRYPGARVFLASEGFDADFPGLAGYFRHRSSLPPFSKGSLRHFMSQNILRDELSRQELLQLPVTEHGAEMDYCISLGGIRYQSGSPYLLYACDRGLFEKRTRLELWDAAVEPTFFDTEMHRDLNLFGRILAADSNTHQTLSHSGFDTSLLLPGLPFALEPMPAPLPQGFSEGGVIGLCLSPQRFDYYREIAFLVRHMLKSTYFCVIPIPYCTLPESNDNIAHRELRLIFENDPAGERILRLDQSLNAPQTHWLFSKLRMLVTTRAEAAAAAMSGNVPVLLIGGGEHGDGLLKDTLGDLAGLCRVGGVEPLAQELIRGFNTALMAGEAVTKRLSETVPEIRKKLEEQLTLHE